MRDNNEAQPLACSLNDQAFRERRALARRTLVPKAQRIARHPNGIRISFEPGDQLRTEIDAFIELERQCCEFLDFAVDESPEQLDVTISGPPEASDVIAIFAETISGNANGGQTQSHHNGCC